MTPDVILKVLPFFCGKDLKRSKKRLKFKPLFSKLGFRFLPGLLSAFEGDEPFFKIEYISISVGCAHGGYCFCC